MGLSIISSGVIGIVVLPLLLLLITSVTLALTAILIRKRNPKQSVAVLLIAIPTALLSVFFLLNYTVIALLAIVVLVIVFLILSIVKKDLALLLTVLSIILIPILLLGIPGFHIGSCSTADAIPPEKFIVLGYMETQSSSECAVGGYHWITNPNETGETYITVYSGDFIVPEYAPDGRRITIISSNAFSDVGDFRAVTVNSIRQIYRAAFSYCNNLKVANLYNVEFIDMYAFHQCRSLEIVRLSSELQHISDWAFSGCDNLQKIYFEGTAESWHQIQIGEGNDILYNVEIEFLG